MVSRMKLIEWLFKKNNSMTETTDIHKLRMPPSLSITSLILGILFVIISIAGSTCFIDNFSHPVQRLTTALGISLIVFGLGSRASGTYGKWSVQGVGAFVIIFYLLIPTEPPESAVIARMIGFPEPDEESEEIRTVEAFAESKKPLFGYFYRSHPEFKVRIEDKDLKSGCLSFIVVPMKGKEDLLKVHPVTLDRAYKASRIQREGLLKSLLASLGLEHLAPQVSHIEIVELTYHSDKEGNGTLTYLDKGERKPASQPSDQCSLEMASSARTTQYALSLVTQAHAQVQDESSDQAPSNQSLIESLTSEDVIRRYEAQRILSTRQPDVIRLILEKLQKHNKDTNEWENLAVSLAKVIRGMLQREVKPISAKDVQTQLNSKEGLEALVWVLTHHDSSYKLDAMVSLIRLRDPRLNSYLVEILKGQTESEGKYYAALVLIGGGLEVELDHNERVALKRSIVSGDRDEAVRILLNVINLPPSASHEEKPESESAPIGWVYIGINFGGPWEERYFDWSGKSNLPQEGDILEATGSVYLRKEYIKFDPNVGRWLNAEVVGLVSPGEKLRVNAIENVASGFYWAEVTPPH